VDGLRIKCTNTYCHTTAVHAGADMGGTNTSPIWTKVDGSQVFCGSCHGFPPVTGSSPHPKDAYQCPDCHKNLSSGFVFKDPSLHVNGKVDMTVGVDL
jgi:predicted CxxxxCH...CXXCH cytochrome family protein